MTETEQPTVAPVLSSEPDYSPAATVQPSINKSLPDAVFASIFEVERTLSFVKGNGYKRVALQFPDELLPDSTRVVDLLEGSLRGQNEAAEGLCLEDGEKAKFYILGDTSYGACCVDEIAAEHCDADAVVHYGRACLSPTARLPVLHIFTTLPLHIPPLLQSFKSTYPDLSTKVILLSSLPYITHIKPFAAALASEGYTAIFAAEVLHKPHSPIPNRACPDNLSEWSIFHIGDVIPSLTLTLASRVASIYTYDTTTSSAKTIAATPLLRRRYALLNSVRVNGIIGILVNTLSATNYLPVITELKNLLKKHGKKSYMFVVGKVNIAKLSNFSEVEVWCVVGCWESSLLDTDRQFFAPCVTSWEVKVALEGGEGSGVEGWRSDFEEFLGGVVEKQEEREEEEPFYDLRTGRLVYEEDSAPMRIRDVEEGEAVVGEMGLVTVSKERDVARIAGQISPAAAYLKGKRQWTGLGSDYDETLVDSDGAIVEVGRDGIARGYKWNGGAKT